MDFFVWKKDSNKSLQTNGKRQSFLLNFLTRFINLHKKHINILFDKVYIVATGCLVIISEYTPEDAMKEYKALKVCLLLFRKLSAQMEHVNFYNDTALEEKVQITLDKLYELEAELKIIAYSDHSKTSVDKAFIGALTDMSTSAIGKSLYKAS